MKHPTGGTWWRGGIVLTYLTFMLDGQRIFQYKLRTLRLDNFVQPSVVGSGADVTTPERIAGAHVGREAPETFLSFSST